MFLCVYINANLYMCSNNNQTKRHYGQKNNNG